MDPETKKQIDELKQEIQALRNKRIYQQDLTPGAVKTRHIGEGAPYLLAGLAAKRPARGSLVTQGAACYFATDTGVLSIWNGTSWINK